MLSASLIIVLTAVGLLKTLARTYLLEPNDANTSSVVNNIKASGV